MLLLTAGRVKGAKREPYMQTKDSAKMGGSECNYEASAHERAVVLLAARPGANEGFLLRRPQSVLVAASADLMWRCYSGE